MRMVRRRGEVGGMMGGVEEAAMVAMVVMASKLRRLVNICLKRDMGVWLQRCKLLKRNSR